MTIKTLIADHQIDLCEFVENHIGIDSCYSKKVCQSTQNLLGALSSDQLLQDYSEASYFFSYQNQSPNKIHFVNTLQSQLIHDWNEIGIEHSKINLLTSKFIPFVISIVSYKLMEKEYELQDMIEYDYLS